MGSEEAVQGQEPGSMKVDDEAADAGPAHPADMDLDDLAALAAFADNWLDNLDLVPSTGEGEQEEEREMASPGIDGGFGDAPANPPVQQPALFFTPWVGVPPANWDTENRAEAVSPPVSPFSAPGDVPSLLDLNEPATAEAEEPQQDGEPQSGGDDAEVAGRQPATAVVDLNAGNVEPSDAYGRDDHEDGDLLLALARLETLSFVLGRPSSPPPVPPPAPPPASAAAPAQGSDHNGDNERKDDEQDIGVLSATGADALVQAKSTMGFATTGDRSSVEPPDG